MPLKRLKPPLGHCKATTSSGKPCRAKPHKGGLCFFHSDPQKAAELGQKGGRRNRHTYETPLQHVTVPESAGDVKRGCVATFEVAGW
jgi:general stress protein YciG